MCGRYAFSHSTADLQALFDVVNPDELAFEPRYNIAPTQVVPIVFSNREGLRSAGRARWGLIPGWVKDPKEWRASTFNARSEEVASKPTYRNAFKRGRILVPATGFYEWMRNGAEKRPFFIRPRDRTPLAFAGLMDVWRDKQSDERLVSCTILTTAAVGPMTELHSRMPVIVAKDEYEPWLTGDDSSAVLEEVIANMPADRIESYEVDRLVNNTRNDEARCIEPLASI